MKKIIIAFFAVCVLFQLMWAEQPLVIVKKSPNGHGLLCRSQEKRVLFLSGTPEQMGTAQGELYKKLIPRMVDKIFVVGGMYTLGKDDWFFSRMEEVFKRTSPYTPKRFLVECEAMSKAAGISKKDGYYVN